MESATDSRHTAGRRDSRAETQKDLRAPDWSDDVAAHLDSAKQCRLRGIAIPGQHRELDGNEEISWEQIVVTRFIHDSEHTVT